MKFFATLGLSIVVFFILFAVFNLSKIALYSNDTIEKYFGFFGVFFLIPSLVALFVYTIRGIFDN